MTPADTVARLEGIEQTLRLLFSPGDVVELRCLGTRRGTISGYFDDFRKLARMGEYLSGKVPAVYVTLNPVNPALLARSANKIKAYAKETTADRDILTRRWLPLDFDAVRPAGISSTNQEHELALERARQAREWLREKGWPEPIFADSGNGAHLLYRIDLPNDDEATALLKRVIQAVALFHSGGGVEVDQKVFNAARIWKLYGTLVCKGDNLPDRPHRLARLLEIPESLQVVSCEQLEAMARLCPQPQDEQTQAYRHAGEFDLGRWISEHGLPVVAEGPWGGGGHKWVLNPCPWNPEHTDKAAYIVQFAGGAIAAGCHHNSCVGNDWHALRDVYEPGWRDKKSTRPRDTHAPREEAAEDKKEKVTQAQTLIALAQDAELFHTTEMECYATIPVAGHKETWPIKAKGFRRWLVRRFYAQEGKPPGAQALQDALAVLEAKAQFDGPEMPVFTRLAEKEGAIYLDLANEAWQAVEVTATGWRVVSDPPVKFRRARGMLPLPCPVAGGSIEELRRFVNIPDEAGWRLFVAYLVATLRPKGPYPALLLQGEQGAAKSTTARVARELVDPSTAPLRTMPRDERDLAIAANNSWCIAFDNLSGIPVWLSDAICRLATGMGFATRTLYENAEETIFAAMRPVILNGIDELAARHDLLDRALVLNLPPIPEEKRQDEATFWRDFEAARPRILGALLDAVSAGLRNGDRVKLDRLPRMADFAKWVTACEPALPWPAGGFLAAYVENRADAIELALEADPVAVAVKALLSKEGSWEGTATELLATLTQFVPEQTQRSRPWPKAANALSHRLRRAATFLRQTGVEVEWHQNPTTRRRLIRLGMRNIVRTVRTVRRNPESQAEQGLDGPNDVCLARTMDRSGAKRSFGPEVLSGKGLNDPNDPNDEMRTYSNTETAHDADAEGAPDILAELPPTKTGTAAVERDVVTFQDQDVEEKIFAEVLEEIFPRDSTSQNVTPSQPSNDAGSSDFKSATQREDVTAEKTPKPAPVLNCGGVAAQNQGVEGKKMREPRKRMLWDVVAGSDEEAERADGAGSAGTCSVCGGRSWWKGRSGEILCWNCHPAGPGVDVVDAWDVVEDEDGGVRWKRWGT